MKKMNKKGFTLIEMLAVIAIIAVLVAIIVPAVGSSTMKANAATNAANLRSAAASITIDYVNGTCKTTTTGEGDDAVTTITDFSITPPVEKAADDGITGGTFKAVLDNGEVICSFGDDGTIANYSKVAESGEKIAAKTE
jgi:prepilin-type N-terminal cleavage/methylation domain-containing protein